MIETARRGASSTLLMLWLLLTASVLHASAQPSPAGASASPRTEWSLERPAPIVTIQLRQVAGYVMLVPAGTLFMLYLSRPRPYVLAAALTWAACSAMMLVLSFDSSAVAVHGANTITAGRLAIGAWSLCALIFGAASQFASTWFRRPSTISSGMCWTFVLAAAWIGFGAALLPRAPAILFPSFLLMTLWHLRSAIGYFDIARRYRFVGAALAGSGFLGVALVNSAAAAQAIASGGVGAASSSVAYLNLLPALLLLLGMHLLIFEDLIQELRGAAAQIAKSRDELKTVAVTDPLTGCYNRRLLYEIADHELEQHRRYDLPLSILYIDVDHFKAINDHRGHQTGDEVLATLGAILRELTRQADFVFRWGGDEFLVLLSAAEHDARIKAAQIRRAFLESAIVGDLPDGVDVSIGCVSVPPETRDLAALIDQADREMYRRKRALGA